MLVTEAIEEYQFAVLRLSPATQQWYLERLQRFADWCQQNNIPLEKVKPLQTRKYIDYLSTTPSATTGKPLSSYTVHGHARAIRTFLRWASNEEGIEELVTTKAARVDMPKLDKKVLPIFKPDEIQKLIKASSKEAYPILQKRSRAIVVTLYETGIRAGEVCSLTLENVILEPGNAFIRVFGKGRKEREVGLGKIASTELYKFIHRHRDAPRDEKHVFLTRDRKPMTVTGLNQMLYRLADWSGVEDVHCHKFRHTFAVNYLEAGGDLFDLARLMGHASTEVTRLYLENYSNTQARQKGISVLDRLK